MAVQVTKLLGLRTGTATLGQDRQLRSVCPYCGLTALPAEPSDVLRQDSVSDNAECDEYGERADR